tara:strand:- start:1069 stop:1419 length:351 start_codon:yes stop_codon:yes gene_type:complete
MPTYQHDLTITNRLRISPSKQLGDGSTQTDVIEAAVCIAKATDTDTGEVASTDPWVSIDLSDVTAADFVALDALTGLPQHAVDQFTVWHELQKDGLEKQLQARASAPREMAAPWSS